MPAKPAVTPVPVNHLRDQILAYYTEKSKTDSATGKMRRAFRLITAVPGVTLTTDLSPGFVENLVKNVDGLASSTAADMVRMVNAACGFAVEWGYLDSNPFLERQEIWRRFQCPPRDRKGNRSKFRGPTPKQIRIVLAKLREWADKDVIAHRLFVLSAIGAFSGCSRNEATALQVADVDLDLGTLRINRRLDMTTKKAVILMSRDLVPILIEWLARRDHGRSKLNEAKVAEAKSMRAAGLPLKLIADDLGVAISVVCRAINGVTWKHVQGPDTKSRVFDSPWLLPNLNTAFDGRWTGECHDKTSPYSLKIAGRFAGVEDLSYTDLSRYFRDCIAPGLVLTRAEEVVSKADVPNPAFDVTIGDSYLVPATIGGVAMPALTEAEWDILVVLKSRQPNGVLSSTLDRLAWHPQAGIILRDLIRKVPRWGTVIHFPGKKGRGGIRLCHPLYEST